MKCPKCNSEKVCKCPGGTCLKINPKIKIEWICQDCLNEW